MQVTILNNLGVQVSELLAHELDRASSSGRIHLLDRCEKVAWNVRLLFYVLGRLVEEVLCE